VRAARVRHKPHLALAVARTAWNNYWMLVEDAERIRERLAAAPRVPPGRGTVAARPP
jgi:hypothetical protein